MLQGVELIAFSDDVVIIAKSITSLRVVELLEEATEISLKWLENAGLEVAVEKTEVLIITNKRTNNTVNVKMRGVEITSSPSIK